MTTTQQRAQPAIHPVEIADRSVQRSILSRIVRSDLWHRLVGEDRQRIGDQRAQLLRELADGMKSEEAKKESAGRAFWKADAAAQAAEEAARVARLNRQEAWLAMESARVGADKRRSRILTRLEELADARIDEVRAHVEELLDAARLCVRVTHSRVLEVEYRPREVFIYNADQAAEVIAELRQIVKQLRDLKAQDYGPDPRPRLEQILQRAEAICQPLGVFDDGLVGRRIARFRFLEV